MTGDFFGITDQPSSIDHLGFEPYVNALAAFLVDPRTRPPLTVSIEGDWGMGKSSFLRQLRSRLSNDYVTVEFNPWRHSQSEELWAEFALEFLRQVRSQRGFFGRCAGLVHLWRRRVKWKDGALDALRTILAWCGMITVSAGVPIWLYFSVFGGILSLSDQKIAQDAKNPWFIASRWLLGSGTTAAALLVIVSLWLKVKAFLGNPLDMRLNTYLGSPDYRKRGAFIEEFHRDFKNILAAYLGDRRVFVFLDDLDRCDIARAADLMQAINLMTASDPSVVFVIAMDREKIAAGLAVKQEKAFSYFREQMPASGGGQSVVGLEFGYSYIQKFIQLPFRLPRPTAASIQRLLASLYTPSDALGIIGSDRLQKVVLTVATAFTDNPRVLKHFLNVLRLSLLLAVELGQDWDNPDRANGMTLEQATKYVALCLRWPVLAAEVTRTPDLLAKMQSAALEREVDRSVSPWLARQEVIDFLRAGCWTEGHPDPAGERLYALLDVDITGLARIGTVVAAAESRPGGGGGRP